MFLLVGTASTFSSLGLNMLDLDFLNWIFIRLIQSIQLECKERKKSLSRNIREVLRSFTEIHSIYLTLPITNWFILILTLSYFCFRGHSFNLLKESPTRKRMIKFSLLLVNLDFVAPSRVLCNKVKFLILKLLKNLEYTPSHESPVLIWLMPLGLQIH
jgi:hypothetical protein